MLNMVGDYEIMSVYIHTSITVDQIDRWLKVCGTKIEPSPKVRLKKRSFEVSKD